MATPFESILTQSFDLASDKLAEAIAAMVDKADEAVNAMLAETQNAETQELYR